MKNEVIVKGININYKKINEKDYISLTDLARYANPQEPKVPILTWIRNKDVISFLGVWENLHNPNFKGHEFETFKNEAGQNKFYISPTQLIEKTNAIGLITKAVKYNGGTYAHKDIAFEFASWLSPEFKLYVITEFERLKEQEQANIEWSAKRELAKLNYRIHTDAIKENIVPTLNAKQISFVYANEADVINVALFGMTAKEWRENNPKLEGNIRDYTDILHLVVLSNLEVLNASMIENNIGQKDRLEKLNETAKRQITILASDNNIIGITKLDNQKLIEGANE